MQTTQTVMASLLLAMVVSAQSDPPATARAEVDRLAAEWKSAQDGYRAAMQAAQATDEYKAAVEAKDRKKLSELLGKVARPDAAGFGQRALAAAKRYDGDDQLLLLTWAANESGDPATVAGVVELVREKHLKSAQLSDLLENGMALQRGVGAEAAGELLQQIEAESPHALPRAWAKYWQSVTIQRDKKASDEDKAKAQTLLTEAEKLAEGTALAERIAAPRFEKERLQIGMEAPDIQGEDLDGVAFRLSDYRGKVVVLDFWGFW